MFNNGQRSGNSSPVLTGVTFSGNWVAQWGSALFNNGESRAIYKLPVVTFPNPNGLTPRTGNVYIETTAVKPGDKIRVRIVDADEYDLWAEPV